MKVWEDLKFAGGLSRCSVLEREEVFDCREKVQPLLQSLCRGVSEQEVPAALQGLLANSVHTRFAALSALHLLPCLPTGTIKHTLFAQSRSSYTQWHLPGCRR